MSKALREEIAKAAADYAVPKGAFDDVKGRARKLGDKVYRALVTPAQEQKMNELPESFFLWDRGIHVYVGSRNRFIRKYVRFTENKPITHSMKMSNETISLELGDKLQKLADEEGNLKDKHRDVYNKVLESTSGFYTVEKLVEAWPEVGRFIPAAKKPQLPAIRTRELNNLIGL